MYEAALKATKSRLSAIEQAMFDFMNGTDMTLYTFQGGAQQSNNPISML